MYEKFKKARILHDICPKMLGFYMIIARIIFSRFFLGGGGGGHVPTPMDVNVI